MSQRARKNRQQLATAQRVVVPRECDVCVVGGGAAGLVSAIVSAEAGARVVVLERDGECGRTILATGNGRCNFANIALDPALYNDTQFVEAVCGSAWLNDVLGFFCTCGLAWVEESEGRLYPLSRSAASVRNVLLQRAQRAGVILAAGREVTRVRKDAHGFDVCWTERWERGQTRHTTARAAIVSTGGSGVSWHEQLGLVVASPAPLLCPLACTHGALSDLDGRRVRAKVTLLRGNDAVTQESGEVLFRRYGLSGIAVFNLSRHALTGDTLVLDLLPTLSLDKALALAQDTLDGILDPVVGQALLQDTGSTNAAIARAKELRMTVEGTTETSHAQVTRGGLLNNQFDTSTLEAHDIAGLFACGEALDVDGPCGGFNLAWAWKSGMVAGAAAAEKSLR